MQRGDGGGDGGGGTSKAAAALRWRYFRPFSSRRQSLLKPWAQHQRQHGSPDEDVCHGNLLERNFLVDEDVNAPVELVLTNADHTFTTLKPIEHSNLAVTYRSGFNNPGRCG